MRIFGNRVGTGFAADQRGFVLVSVLIVIALLLPVVLAFYSSAQLHLAQAGNFRDSIQAVRFARAGVEGAIGLLQMDDASYDCDSDSWAMPFPPLSLGDGILEVKITDEESKLNVNSLVTTDGKTVSAQTDRHLRRLIQRLGGKPEIVDALIDWIDTDSEVKGEAGAEDVYYTELGYKAKNGPLDSLDELSTIKGFDNELLADLGLKNLLTVVTTDGKLNINTAPIDVLYDLHEELREGLVEEIVKHRQEQVYKTPGDVKNAIGITDTLYAKILPLIKVNSSIFTVKSRYTAGKMVKQVEAVLKRDGATVTVIAWREL
jgi:general secretion pathway protein K